MALVVQPPLKGARGLVFEKLLELPVGIIVPPEHAFARRRCVTLDEALCEPLVAYSARATRTTITGSPGCSNRLDANPASPAQWTERSASSPQWKPAREIGFAPSTFTAVAGRRVKFVRLSPAAPPLAVAYVVRAAHRSEILEKFINALLSITRGSAARREQRSQTCTCLELPRPLPC